MTQAKPDILLYEDFSEGMENWWAEGGVRTWVEDGRLHVDADPEAESALESRLTQRMLGCQRQDRAYWRDIISELAEMRRRGELIPPDSPVTTP